MQSVPGSYMTLRRQVCVLRRSISTPLKFVSLKVAR